MTNDRLLGAQWWFGLRDPVDEWGVAATTGTTTRRSPVTVARLAMTDRGQQLVVAATNGPAWSGEPPYPEPDYVNPDSGFAEPAIVCRGPVGKTENPTWSADGTRLAYGAADGVHVVNADCSGDTLLVPGGDEPAFGPADVRRVRLRRPPAAPSSSRRVSLRPRAFRRATTVRFTLSAPARVTLKVKGAKGRSPSTARRARTPCASRRRGLSRGLPPPDASARPERTATTCCRYQRSSDARPPFTASAGDRSQPREVERPSTRRALRCTPATCRRRRCSPPARRRRRAAAGAATTWHSSHRRRRHARRRRPRGRHLERA